MKISMLVGAAAILALAIDPALAAPCHAGPTAGKDPTPQTVNTKSSDVDKEGKNLASGPQPASPGTVGAMNNVGADQD